MVGGVGSCLEGEDSEVIALGAVGVMAAAVALEEMILVDEGNIPAGGEDQLGEVVRATNEVEGEQLVQVVCTEIVLLHERLLQRLFDTILFDKPSIFDQLSGHFSSSLGPVKLIRVRDGF